METLSRTAGPDWVYPPRGPNRVCLAQYARAAAPPACAHFWAQWPIGFVSHDGLGRGEGVPSGNWVRFAHLPRVPRPCGPVPPGTPGNWVCFAQPPPAEGGGVPGAAGKLGLFRTIRPLSARPHPLRRRRELALFRRSPLHAKLTITIFPQRTYLSNRPGANWVCFARQARCRLLLQTSNFTLQTSHFKLILIHTRPPNSRRVA